MKTWITCGVLVAMMGTASADNDDLAPRHFNYRKDLLLADGLSFGTIAAATAAGTWMFSSDDFHFPLMIGAVGFGGYVLAAPVIHMSRGNLGRGAISLGLRIISPAIAGATLTTFAGKDEKDAGYGSYMFGGMALGAAVASALDIWLLVPDAPNQGYREKPPTAPMITPVAGGAVAGIAGYW